MADQAAIEALAEALEWSYVQPVSDEIGWAGEAVRTIRRLRSRGYDIVKIEENPK